MGTIPHQWNAVEAALQSARLGSLEDYLRRRLAAHDPVSRIHNDITRMIPQGVIYQTVRNWCDRIKAEAKEVTP